ncbi:hypothetical protein BOTBODRAFT_189237 [Botryobasidium botryosum FD-172 SS1]|uniref:FAD synthase n=1 Tax=Botryobasidium botryosum (strain FD-172 SS1) TaxID=930990 RepID=A0A067MCU2_BOTB1|nr:hypothetical protein BOTBODRAFT_189237 [Botryobasidium botryosum FD-172 SS1]
MLTEESLAAVYDLSYASDSLGLAVREALQVIEDVLKTHGLDHVAISFNGGKDCTVLLHLFAAVIYRNSQSGTLISDRDALPTPPPSDINSPRAQLLTPYENDTPVHSFPPSPSVRPSAGPLPLLTGVGDAEPGAETEESPPAPPAPLAPMLPPATTAEITKPVARSFESGVNGTSSVVLPPLKSVYITCESPFTSVEDFIEEMVDVYNLRITRVSGRMKEALREYLEGSRGQDRDGRGDADANGDGPAGRGVKAMLVGTRRNDPHGAKLDFVTPTDNGWPALLRVHPIINWSYRDVWDFLRVLNVPYCDLYDAGYTSLGSTYNTFPNPALQDPSLPSGYRPAYELIDGSLERAGRARCDPEVKQPAL